MFRGVNEVLLGVIECIFALLILHFAKMNIFFAQMISKRCSTHKNISHLLFETTENLFVTFEQRAEIYME